MQIGGTPFGQLTQLGQDLFDKFRQGKGLDETLAGDKGSQSALPAGQGGFGPAALLPDLGNTQTGLNGGNAVTGTGNDTTTDPVSAAFELLQRDLTSMFGMLGYDEDNAKGAAKAMTDAAKEAYSNGQSFSYSQVAVETAELYQQGPNGSMYMGTLSAQSIELYVDPATGTFSAKAVSVEIKAAQVETTQPQQTDFSKWRDSQDALFGALDLGSPLQDSQSIAQLLLEKMRKLQEELAKQREAQQALEASLDPASLLAGLAGTPTTATPTLVAGDQSANAALASTLTPKDVQDIGTITDKGVLALRLDALVPMFGRPAKEQAEDTTTTPPKSGFNVVA
jgi:hypothetical protein